MGAIMDGPVLYPETGKVQFTHGFEEKGRGHGTSHFFSFFSSTSFSLFRCLPFFLFFFFLSFSFFLSFFFFQKNIHLCIYLVCRLTISRWAHAWASWARWGSHKTVECSLSPSLSLFSLARRGGHGLMGKCAMYIISIYSYIPVLWFGVNWISVWSW